jgi:hypothetical protein
MNDTIYGVPSMTTAIKKVKPIGAAGYCQVPGFITETNAHNIALTVKGLREHWVKTDEHGNYCLGLDFHKFTVDGLPNGYHTRAGHYNDILSAAFPDMAYDVRRMTNYVTDPEGRSSLPVKSRSNLWTKWGFLISDKTTTEFDADEDSSSGLPMPHMDYDGFSLYPEKMFDEETRAYTATVCIEQPADGGGLTIWPHRSLAPEFYAPSYSNGINGDTKFEALVKGELEQPVHLPYTIGGLTIFDLFLPHAVSPLAYSEQQPLRIVMVVHFCHIRGHFEHWF